MLSLLYHGPSREVLHNQFAKHGRIDQQAPVTAAGSMDIAAAPQRVWQVLADPVNWPAVDPAITDVRLPAGVAVDAPFTWRNGRARMSSRFAVLDPGREVTWTGVSFGAKAVHRHVLHPLSDQSTRLDSEESVAGPLLSLFYDSAQLARSLTGWLTAVKAAAERQS